MKWQHHALGLLVLSLHVACGGQQATTAPASTTVRMSQSGQDRDRNDDDRNNDGRDHDDRNLLPLSRFMRGDHDDACEGRSFRAFDFWTGRWNVTESSGTAVVGTNVVTATLGGCAIEEHWSDTAGVRGRSLNTFDAESQKWSQLWMDQTGGALELQGIGNGQRMQLAGTHQTNRTDPTPLTDRITWTASGRDRVRQVGELAVNGGPFSQTYDLSYKRVREPVAIAPSSLEFCSSPARPRFHAFDFLLGNWTVRRNGASARLNSRVSTDLGGCLLEERMSGPGGYQAVAYAGFRSATFVWNWMFMDNRGVQLMLSGPATLTGTSMTLTGRKTDQRGNVVDVRVEWISTGATTVEQRWAFSTDGGVTWSVPEVLTMTR